MRYYDVTIKSDQSDLIIQSTVNFVTEIVVEGFQSQNE